MERKDVAKSKAMYRILQATSEVNEALPESANRTDIAILLNGMEKELEEMEEQPRELVHYIFEHVINVKRH